MDTPPPLVGLVAAAGRATRLQGIDGSKELERVPAPGTDASHRPVSEYLLRALAHAGVERAYLVLRTGKWDVAEHFAAEPPPGLELAYLMTAGTDSIPASLNLGYPFVRGATVVTGFADSCFAPLAVVGRALARHRQGKASITLALVPSDRPDKTDMVEVAGNRVTRLAVKPGHCGLQFTYCAVVWAPEFTEFLHDLLASPDRIGDLAAGLPELQISQVLSAALTSGFEVEAEIAPEGRYIDVGTPDDLARVRQSGLAR